MGDDSQVAVGPVRRPRVVTGTGAGEHIRLAELFALLSLGAHLGL